MNEILIESIRRRAADPGRRTDHSDVIATTVAPAASNSQLSDAEQAIGFELPEVLKSVFQSVGNGGFGPGYGLMGTDGGATDDTGATFVSMYKLFTAENSEQSDEPNWDWPKGLVPICHWGCAIYSCVDLQNGASMAVWDPNGREPGSSPRTAIRYLDRDLTSWLDAWTKDVDLWSEMYPE